MINYQGSIASKGIAIGKIRQLKPKDDIAKQYSITDVDSEKSRFFTAKDTAVSQLEKLYHVAVDEVGEENALIFEIHSMMLEDDDYIDAILDIIVSEKLNAEYAVSQTAKAFSEMFANMDDEYMKARSADILDISQRIINILLNADSSIDFTEKCIIVADDLTPSETIQMDKSKILGFVTRQGSVNSHTAILARTMSIPAIVNANIPMEIDDVMAVLDGFEGVCTINPSDELLENAKKIANKEQIRKNLLQQYKNRESITKSGKKVNLYANVGSIDDVKLAVENDAEGVGLFRSEFIYLGESDFPSEDLQFNIYKEAATLMGDKKLIIRTMDIGADKQIEYFNLGKEENPALGYRAIRICLNNKEMFKTQLRALLRASVYGNIAIMVPMIISVWEVESIRKTIKEVKSELEKEGIAYLDVEFGIMIETPAAAILADDFAPFVDFFSIGTNDLTQYTLAIDRQNQSLDKFYNPRHKSVLKLIEMVAKTAKRHGIWAGICGELGADVSLTKTFIDYGIEELSVNPSAILSLRETICNLD